MADRRFKNEAIKAAKDLNYGADIIAQVKEAKTADEVSKIMWTVRNQTMIVPKPKPALRPDFLAWVFA